MIFGDMILEICGLMKEFRGFIVVNGVNLCVWCGVIYVLIGLNGVGKIICFNFFIKFLMLMVGQIVFNGIDIIDEWFVQVVWCGIICLFQILVVFLYFIVLQNVCIGL